MMTTLTRKLIDRVRDSNTVYLAIDEDERVACPRREGKPMDVDRCFDCLFYRGSESDADSGIDAIRCRRDRSELLLATYG